MNKLIDTILLLLFTACHVLGQPPNSQVAVANDALRPCISTEEYAQMERDIARNEKLLGLDNKKKGARTTANVTLEWPLKAAVNLKDYNYFYISAYVDQSKTAGVTKDWNCGAKTYDGHRGVDIVPWPFIWDKMDNNLVEVIAAAPGTIVAKVDGNPDRICNGVGGGSTSNNYISILHSDGSLALYVHMKTGSLTTKKIGDAVATGEFLGIPGSSGQSTGVHLHFEVRSDGTFANYIDPFFGACSTGNTSSWWANQRPYKETEIVKLSVNDNWPYAGVCPITKDTTHQVNSFPAAPGAQGIFSTYTKSVLAGMIWNFKILNPDGSLFKAWDFTNLSERNTSALEFPQTRPHIPGTYTFQVTFNGKVHSINFDITVVKQSQNITFDALPAKTYGDANFNLTATSSSGLPITYTSSNLQVATVSGNAVAIVGAGNTNITAAQLGDGTFLAAQNIITPLTVNKASQAITFGALISKNNTDTPFALTATASSALAVNYNSNNAAVATVSGNTVTLVGVGSTLITASQPGNSNYNAAPNVMQTLTVNTKSNQTITFNPLVDKTIGDAAFALVATASSGLTVNFSSAPDKITIVGDQATIVKPGRATITASQAGNAVINAAQSVDQSFCIKPAKPTIILTNTNTELPTLTSSATVGNQWFWNGNEIIGGTNATHNPTQAGVYKVQAKVDDCASEFSLDQAIIVTGDLEHNTDSSKGIYPNPVLDWLTVSLGGAVGLKEVAIFQATGAKIDSQELVGNEARFFLAEYSPGIYLVKIETEHSVKVIRLYKK